MATDTKNSDLADVPEEQEDNEKQVGIRIDPDNDVETGGSEEGGGMHCSCDCIHGWPLMSYPESMKTVQDAAVSEKPYSIYNIREKWGIVIMASIAGLFR